MSTELTKIDPRVRRTMQMLTDAFSDLLKEKAFDMITVQDIVKRSTLNRATFYDHFPDKFALLASIMRQRFRALIEEKVEKNGEGECAESLKQLVLAACEFLSDTASGCQKHQHQFEPMVEAQVKAVIQDYLLEGFRSYGVQNPELKATMVSWGIAGAALQWSRERSISADALAKEIIPLIVATLRPKE